MQILPFRTLLDWILKELEERGSIFGIHRTLFHAPIRSSPYAVPDIFGQYLATPIGPAAGPHTQLAQNIVCAWLSGGRFIELKTVQIRDELEIPRPCIDMEDEGYNVEWSQELRLDESAGEYIKAWALIHVLYRLLGYEERGPLGTVFNTSVGYDLAGIRSGSVTRFLDRMKDASAELALIRNRLRAHFPQFADVEIPAEISNNATLSTMHGCRPAEIEEIARYLMEQRGLHTTVKLNPTLLGKETVSRILHDALGFRELRLSETVFEEDLQYGQAVDLIRSLRKTAREANLTFAVKLSNTLPLLNHKKHLPGSEMYMSGRALYPVTINLFRRLSDEFSGDLNVSFSGGVDALNVTTVLACGARPVTVVSDLLKPGGYSRLLQYLENLETAMRERGTADLDELSRDRLANLRTAADAALVDPRYRRAEPPCALPKVESGLGLFDCIAAPCVAQCAVCQDVPEYAWLVARGDYDHALEVILACNPLPGVTGYVCTQLCQTRCTRSVNNYDEPVAIRAIKRFAADRGRVSPRAGQRNGFRVAIVGSGPSGLAAAYFLVLNGVEPVVFEARGSAGGMMRLAPPFRLPSSVIQEDIDRITGLGVDLRLSCPVVKPPEELLRNGYDAVYVASGFQKDLPLYVEGIEGKGVYAALDLLRRVRQGDRTDLGPRVLVIGGGDTALDAARAARRLGGDPVTVVYRRGLNEMPAGEEDRQGAWEEGILLQELASPTRIILRDGRVSGLECRRNVLGEPDEDGRRRPVPVEGSEFRIPADSVIVAVGQSPDITFLDGSAISLNKDGSIAAERATGGTGALRIYAGGDAVRGPESIIAACADGRRAAEAICRELCVEFRQPAVRTPVLSEDDITWVKRVRARKEARHRPDRLEPHDRRGFDLIEATLAEPAARSEAARCLQCSTICDKCVEVCPNRANQSYCVSSGALHLPTIACEQGKLVVKGETLLRVEQTRQIVHLHELCNECGNCETFCVHQGEPHQQKPRLFFDAGRFARESDNAFHIRSENGRWVIRRCECGRQSELAIESGGRLITFENDLVRLALSVPGLEVLRMELKKDFEGKLALAELGEMYMILQGLSSSMAFLPGERPANGD